MTDPFRREFFGLHSLPDLARGPRTYGSIPEVALSPDVAEKCRTIGRFI
jgi:hypothetical protein